MKPCGICGKPKTRCEAVPLREGGHRFVLGTGPRVKVPTLVEKAKGIPVSRQVKKEISREEVDLALAWASGEITFTQVQKTLGYNKNGNSTYLFLSKAFRQALEKGILKVRY